MNDYKLSTEEAKELIELIKNIIGEKSIKFPKTGENLELYVDAINTKDKFIINIRHSKDNSKKCTYQGRTKINNIPLMRIDIGSNLVHMNTDGTKIKGNHIHIYNETTEMDDAIPFEENNEDLYKLCMIFFDKFNILKDEVDIMCQEQIF